MKEQKKKNKKKRKNFFLLSEKDTRGRYKRNTEENKSSSEMYKIESFNSPILFISIIL